jgi:hypothetical protein
MSADPVGIAVDAVARAQAPKRCEASGDCTKPECFARAISRAFYELRHLTPALQGKAIVELVGKHPDAEGAKRLLINVTQPGVEPPK